MAFLNKSVKNQVFQEEGNLDRESVERILGFVEKNKKELAKFGYESEKPVVQTPNPKVPSQMNNNFQAPSNFTPPKNTPPGNVNHNRNEPPPQNNLNVIPQPKTRELMSTLANQKMSQVSVKEKVQKECNSAITDINANRIVQAKNELENAIALLRQLRR